MIKTLEIKNFKSIKYLKLDCKRVNLFIGKPNAGKSNILESVGIFSLPFVGEKLDDIVRFENMANLFYDQDVSQKMEIIAGALAFEIKFENGNFRASQEDKERNIKLKIDFDYAGKGNLKESQGDIHLLPKFYRFAVMGSFARYGSDFLMPPKGENLLQILFTNKDLRKSVANIFSEYGLRIVLKPQEYKIEIQKEIDDVIVAHPYFLLSVFEKTSKDDIGIFITYFQEYQTKVRTLAETEVPEILDLDASVFFNLNHLG